MIIEMEMSFISFSLYFQVKKKKKKQIKIVMIERRGSRRGKKGRKNDSAALQAKPLFLQVFQLNKQWE